MKKLNKKLTFIVIFSLLGLVALQIPVSRIIGSTQSFSLFDFFAPTTGLFLNSLPGFISVLLVKLFDLIFIKKSIDFISILRLLPLPLAAFYFGSKSKYKSVVALLCMVLFVVHPIGRQAWVYSLYWLIPFIAGFFPKRLFLKALGSTFTAHAVGSVVFLYTVGLPPAVWLGLIPVVFVERIGFAAGIYASYFIMNFILSSIISLLKLKDLEFLLKHS